MAKLNLESGWDKVKSLILESVPDLTDDDLEYTPGEDDALVEKLSKKMNRSFEDTKGWIESVSHNSGKAS